MKATPGRVGVSRPAHGTDRWVSQGWGRGTRHALERVVTGDGGQVRREEVFTNDNGAEQAGPHCGVRGQSLGAGILSREGRGVQEPVAGFSKKQMGGWSGGQRDGPLNLPTVQPLEPRNMLPPMTRGAWLM